MSLKRKRSTKKSYPSYKRKKTQRNTLKKAFKTWKNKTFKRKSQSSKLKGKPKKTGSKHWLSYGKSYPVGKRPFINKLTKLLAPTFQLLNYAGRVTPATPGVQAITTIDDQYSPYDIANYNYTQYSVVPTTGSPTETTTRVILESCTSRSFLTNQSNCPAFIELYDVVSRRDLQAGKSPVDNWTDGITQERNVTGTSTMVSSTPFQSELFTQNWKVVRVTRLNLAVGETAEHIKTSKPMRLWNHAIEGNQFGGGAIHQMGVRNLTTFTIMVVIGAPDNDSTTKTTVSTGTPSIDWVTSKNYRWTALQNNATWFTGTNNLPATYAVGEEVMNSASGAIAAEVDA